MKTLLLLAALTQDGEKAFARCASCHVTPDRSIEADQIWTGLIKTTA